MKSPYAILLAAGIGLILGLAVTAFMGVRDAICTKVSWGDPVYVAAQRSIATSYKKLGNACMPFDAEAAHAAYEQSLPIDMAITATLPGDSEAISAAAYCDERLGLLTMSLDRYDEAAHWFQAGLQILEEIDRGLKPGAQLPAWIVADEAPLTIEEKAAGRALYQYWLGIQRKNLTICQNAQHAIDELNFALGQPKERVPELLLIRGRALAKHGRHADAVATAERLAAQAPPNGEQSFNAARIYALAAANIKSHTARALSADERAIRERYLARAVALLAQAASREFFDEPEGRTSLKMDRDFLPLHDRDDFNQCLAKIAMPH